MKNDIREEQTGGQQPGQPQVPPAKMPDSTVEPVPVKKDKDDPDPTTWLPPQNQPLKQNAKTARPT